MRRSYMDFTLALPLYLNSVQLKDVMWMSHIYCLIVISYNVLALSVLEFDWT